MATDIDDYNAQEGARIEALFKEQMPEWAIGPAHGLYSLGAQLPTRDGRRMGNAHIIAWEMGTGILAGRKLWTVLTDAGTKLRLTENELMELFHPPQWVSDVAAVLEKFDREG